jgi:hypothetical protein
MSNGQKIGANVANYSSLNIFLQFWQINSAAMPKFAMFSTTVG